jgi:hypothetical protein
MNFMKGMAKYTWQDCRNNEDILLEIKINRVVKQMDRDSLPHLIVIYQPW